ncbi:Alpha/Beta hydrolase protein [Roridomyces roridus]|uniref:Alpha/Beta hydrolase protein n=1 Tax=Roridomyces roridus TaxID=1738132 RepID=A0AAD7CEC6_9AGAR|nr:Alpha/Beta hydrolase protein [Roridomyces roridus]
MLSSLTLGLLLATACAATPGKFNLRPFKIDLSSEVARMKTLVNNTRLPSHDLYPEVGIANGIELGTLEELKNEWTTSFDWETQQAELNEFSHFTAEIEGLTVHFINQKSTDPDAIPLILVHGWPGSFQEFAPVIKPLTSLHSTDGKTVSYNVVVPSLPGFVFSSPSANASWTYKDTARVFNTLMTEVLGYETYTVHGTDWGAVVAYDLYANYNTTVRGGHFVFVPFVPLTPEQLAAENITLTPEEAIPESLYVMWSTTGDGYFHEQATRPKNLGFALYDSPVGQLSWIGSIWKNMSDPRAGTPPSLLSNTPILTSVSLYFLTSSFYSSIWIYEQNQNPLSTVYSKPPTDAPLFFSMFAYNQDYWPEEKVREVGNLISYEFHEFGGHFPAWDNPPALIEDIRAMGLFLRG